MGAREHYKSTLIRAKAIKELTAQHYEAGNNSKCYRSVWRNVVYPTYGCTYGTYLSYLRMATDDYAKEKEKEDPRQMRLFD